jgi:diketogulonate reductase-like aldo/keto reductase
LPTGTRAEVGNAIKKSGIPRAHFFVTTKIIGPPESLDPQETYDTLVKAVDAFGLGENCLISAVAPY